MHRSKNWLFEPHPKIIEEEQRRQAKFLSQILLFLFLMVLGYLLIVYLILSQQPIQAINASITLALILAVYGISRTQWYETAVYIFAIGFGLIIVSTLEPSQLAALLLIYFLLPVTIAAMVLSIQRTSLVALIELIAMMYLIFQVDSPLHYWMEIAFLITLYLTTVSIILLSLRHRNQLEKTRQAQIMQQEARLQTYFDNATDWLFALDPAGKVTAANKTACQDLGYSADEIIGYSPVRFALPEQQAELKKLIQEIFAGKDVPFVEVGVQGKDGRPLWIEIKGRKLIESGNVVGTFHVARNITDRKAEEAAREKLIEQNQNELAERKRAEMEARKRQTIAETLQAATAILNSTLSLDDILKQILIQLRYVIPYDSATIQQKEDEVLVLKAANGFKDEASLIGLNFQLDANLPNTQVVNTKSPLAVTKVHDAYPEFNRLAAAYQAESISSWLGVPLIADNEVIGMITIDRNEERPFTPDEITLATTFANHAAMGLHNAALYHKLEAHSDLLEKAVATRTQELQHSTDQIRAILRNSPDAILVLNADQSIRQWNAAFRHLFEYTVDEIPSIHFLDLAAEADQSKLKHALQTAVSTHLPRRLEITAQSKNGRLTQVNAALAPIQENNILTGIVCSLHDISQLKEVERLKDTFVSNVSHELRTPITNLRLHHDLIHLNPQKQDVYLARLGREIDRLNIIIEDLLHISRLDQKRIKPILAELNLPTLAQQYLNDRQSSAASKQIALTLAQEPAIPAIQGDSRLLEQVISALLTNAMAYTPAGGEIQLTPRLKQKSSQTWVGLAISDTGIGIPENEQTQIFTRFFRGQSAIETGEPGTGLGLAIAQEIMRLHEGYIELEHSSPKQGTTFVMWLPTSHT